MGMIRRRDYFHKIICVPNLDSNDLSLWVLHDTLPDLFCYYTFGPSVRNQLNKQWTGLWKNPRTNMNSWIHTSILCRQPLVFHLVVEHKTILTFLNLNTSIISKLASEFQAQKQKKKGQRRNDTQVNFVVYTSIIHVLIIIIISVIILIVPLYLLVPSVLCSRHFHESSIRRKQDFPELTQKKVPESSAKKERKQKVCTLWF